MRYVKVFTIALSASILCTGCATPASRLEKKRNMAARKEMMKLFDRKAPPVGEVAPDFTLSALGSDRTITRSSCEGSKPLVIIFGSYT